MSCFMPVGHQVGDVLNTSLPRIRSFASSRVLPHVRSQHPHFPFDNLRHRVAALLITSAATFVDLNRVSLFLFRV